jgi:hypothetical protein
MYCSAPSPGRKHFLIDSSLVTPVLAVSLCVMFYLVVTPVLAEALTDRLAFFFATPEPVFLNVYGAQELIPRNEFRQPM